LSIKTGTRSPIGDMHHADIAEILDELDFDEATYF
jgi:magnesium transporter